MISITRWRTCLGILVLLACPTVVIEITMRAMQAPEGSEGWTIPAGAAMERNPQQLTAAVLARGQNLYKSKCQRCHGADGAGHGPEADAEHPAGDLTDARRASRNPDGVMFYKIWNGRAKPKMPAMKMDVTKTDVWAVIHYINTLRK
jgi:mono/diheme cytochrome c family protein